MKPHSSAASDGAWWFRLASFLLVGLLWGGSNAVLKQATATPPPTSGHKKGKAHGAGGGGGGGGIWDGLRALLGTKAAAAYLVNQSGSVVYYYLLGSYDISLAVPICNSLTFVFTALASYLLGERVDRPGRVALGCLLVLAGVSLCVTSK